MAAPTLYLSGNTGTDAGGTWSYTASTILGAVLIFRVLQDGTTAGAVALTSITAGKFEALDGTDDTLTYIGAFAVGDPTAAIQHLWIGRCIGTGGATISGTNSTSEDLYWDSWHFSNVSTGTTLATVIENGTAGATANGVGTSNTASDTDVTTLGPDRLALNFLAINDDNAVGAWATETGGTWTEVAYYAEASGTDGCIQMLHATMSSAGTIGGATASITDSDSWGVVGFALIGTTPSTRQPRGGFVLFQDPGIV